MTDHVYTPLLMLILLLFGGGFAWTAYRLERRERRRTILRERLKGEIRVSDQAPIPPSILVRFFQKQVPLKGRKMSLGLTFLGIFLGVILALSGAGFFIWGMCGGVYLLILGVFGYGRWQWHQAIAALQKQIPDALETMARMGKVGITPEQMFARLAEEFPAPAREIFTEADQLLKIGVTMEQALPRAFNRYPNRDLFYLQSVLLLHRRVGGNSARLLETLAQNVRARHSQEKQIKILTSEARSAAKVVGGLSFAAVMGLFIMNRAQFDFLLHHEKGHSLIIYAAASTVFGFAIIHQMLRAVK